MPTPKQTQAILESEGIVEFDVDIRTLNRPELAKHFAAESSGRIILTKLIKSIIWQALSQIRDGSEPPVEGNIRTCFYRWVKPVLAHIPDDDNVKLPPYETMLRAFAELVIEHKLFTYAEFGFEDENSENRLIGATRPEVLVFAEKGGTMPFLKRLHHELGVSVLALGGFPSVLTSEYTWRAINKERPQLEVLHLVGIVDYDPAGHNIASSFRDQLNQLGAPPIEMQLIINPKHYSREELQMFAISPSSGQSTRLRNWLEETKGIGGQAKSLEVESMPRSRLRQLIQQAIDDI